ncbi:MAG: 5-deoxy-glucuronate isomerase, partial [Pyrinomonadaceae bacterium]
MSTQQTSASNFVFKGTNKSKGRHISVTPQNSSMKHLAYGRIILDRENARAEFETGEREVGLICLHGSGVVKVGQVNQESFELNRYDSIYIPRDESVEVSTTTAVDFAECSADVANRYPVQVVRFADVEKDGTLKFSTGGQSNARTVNILLGKNIQAGRILAGITRSEAGHWTSWPPHEHADMLEELYVYIDMPPPAFGVQFVYTRPEEPEFVGLVREGDA